MNVRDELLLFGYSAGASIEIAASPATVTAAAQVATVIPAEKTVPATSAVATTQAQAATVTLGAETVLASPANLIVSAQPASVSGAVVVVANPALVTTSAEPATVGQAPITVAASPALLTAQAQALTLALGAKTVEATFALLTVLAQAPTVTGGIVMLLPVSVSCVLGGPTVTCTLLPVTVIVGSNVVVTATFKDKNKELAEPATVTAVVQAPDGTQSNPVPTNESLGVWETVIPTDQVGDWYYQISGEGADMDAVCVGSFCVKPSLVLV